MPHCAFSPLRTQQLVCNKHQTSSAKAAPTAEGIFKEPSELHGSELSSRVKMEITSDFLQKSLHCTFNWRKIHFLRFYEFKSSERPAEPHKQRAALPLDGENEHPSTGRCSLAHSSACEARSRRGNSATWPAAAVISCDTGFLMDSSVFVCVLVWCVSIGATRGWWAGRCCANITFFLPATITLPRALSLSLCWWHAAGQRVEYTVEISFFWTQVQTNEHQFMAGDKGKKKKKTPDFINWDAIFSCCIGCTDTEYSQKFICTVYMYCLYTLTAHQCIKCRHFTTCIWISSRSVQKSPSWARFFLKALTELHRWGFFFFFSPLLFSSPDGRGNKSMWNIQPSRVRLN